MEQRVTKVDFEAVKAIVSKNKWFYHAENKGEYIAIKFRIDETSMTHFSVLEFAMGTSLIFNFYSVDREEFTFLLMDSKVEAFVKSNLENYVGL